MLDVTTIIGRMPAKSLDKFRVGDILQIKYEVRVGYWAIKSFIGICIAKKNLRENTKIILRNVIDNVPVEMNFFLYGPDIVEVKKLPLIKKFKVFRGKLYFLRKKNLNSSKV